MNSYVESFLELIYPEKNICCICGYHDDQIGEKYICVSCSQSLKRIEPPICLKCCKSVSSESSVDLCNECISNEKVFEEARAPFKYTGIIKKSISDFKYHNKAYYFRFFGNLLVEYMTGIGYTNFDYITSVPIHRSKLATRGYNQSYLIAKYISDKISIPYIEILKRTIKTTKQSDKSLKERRLNLKNAFVVKNNNKSILIADKKILLVDDIYTTGSTANECSKELLNFGASKVYVVTIAR